MFSTAILVILMIGAGGASAAIVTLTFDEPGINLGDTITTQYGPGVIFSGAPANVKLPGADAANGGFNNTGFDPLDAQALHVEVGGSTPIATAAFAIAADYLKFHYARPSDTDTFNVQLFNGVNLVFDAGGITWPASDPTEWLVFEYLGALGTYDRLEVSGKKIVFDNFSYGIQAVPLPAPIVLLASPLAGLLWFRRRLNAEV